MQRKGHASARCGPAQAGLAGRHGLAGVATPRRVDAISVDSLSTKVDKALDA
jgi:hypothetical protein